MANNEKRYTAFRVLRWNTFVAIWLYSGLFNIIFACIFANAFLSSSTVPTRLSDWIAIVIVIPFTFLLLSTPLIAHLKLRRGKRSGLVFAAIGSFLFVISPFFIGFFTGTIPTLRSVLFVRKIPTDEWLYGSHALKEYAKEIGLA